MNLRNFKKNFLPIKFLKKNKCFSCHNIKKIFRVVPTFIEIKNKYVKSFKSKKYLFKKIKYGSKNNFKINIIMPSFSNIKNKYLYFFLKWLMNFY